MAGLVNDLITSQLQPRPQQPLAPQNAGGLDAMKTLMEEYSRMSGELPGARKAADTSLSEMLSGLSNYEPNNREAWLSFASNVAKPTKYGTLGEVVSNIGEGLTPIIGKQEALKQQYKQLALQSGYNALEKNADQLQSGRLAILKDMAQYQRGTGIQSAQAANALMRQVTTLYTQQLEGARKQAEGMTNVTEDQRNTWVTETARKNTVQAVDTIFTPEQVQMVLPHLASLLSGGAPAQPQASAPSPQPAPPMTPTGFPGQPTAPNPDEEASRIADRIALLNAEKTRYANQGNFQAAQDVQKTINTLRAQVPASTGTAPAGSPPTGTIAERKAESARKVEQAKKDVQLSMEGPIETAKQTADAEVKRKFAQPTEMTALKEFIDSTAPTLDTAMKLPTHPGLVKATGTEGMIPFRGNVLTAGGTDSADFVAQIHKLADQLAFQKLQAMRAASANGASGLGQVTEKEHDMLRQQIATLDLKQKPEVIQAEINQIQDRLVQMRQRIIESYTSKYPSTMRVVKNVVYVQGKDGLWNPL